MKLFNLVEFEYVLYWEHLISFSFTIKTGHQLVGNSVTITLSYPKIVRHFTDIPYLWDDKKTADPDDIPF